MKIEGRPTPSFRRRACPVPRYGAGIQRGEGRRPATFIPLMWPSQGHGHSGEEPAPYPDTGPESRGARGGGPPLSFLLCGLRKAMVIPAKSLPRTPIRGRNPEGRGEEARHFHSSYVAFARPWSFRRRACPVPRYGAGIQRGEGRRPATFIPLMWPSQGHGHSGEEPAPYPDTGPESRGARGGGPPLSFLLCGLRKAMVIPAKSLPRTPIRGRNPEGRGEEARHFHSSYVAFARPWSFRRRPESRGGGASIIVNTIWE